MKANRKWFCLLTSVFALTLSGCIFGYEDIFGDKLKSISIGDTNKAYAVGETFSNEANLKIIATYNNNSTKVLSLSDVEPSLVNTDNESFDIYKAFTTAGVYSFSVSMSYVKSNTLYITVLNEHIYATSISISQKNVKIDAWAEKEYVVTVTPNDATAHIEYTSSDDSIVKVTSTSTGMLLYGAGGGEADITAKIASGIGTYVTDTLHVTVDSSIRAMAMSQTYNDVIKNSAYQVSGCPLEGFPKLLVIPVWFTDSAKYVSVTKKDSLREDIEAVYFGQPEDTGWESVYSYYLKESDGKLNIMGTVSDWYDSGISTKDAGGYTSKNTATLVNTATNWYFSTTGESRQDYDFDHDGYLDGVMLIYAAPDNQTSAALAEYSNLWAYCFWIQQGIPQAENPIPNVFFWASYDFIYGKETAFERTGNSYYNGDTSHCSLDGHTYIHEMGHVLGLDDYYDYGGNHYNPAGGFSMQDCNVGGHDPYSLLALGWARAYIPGCSMSINLRSFQSSHEVVLLTPQWNSYNSPFDEYLILELYTPEGLNKRDTDYQYSTSYPQGVDAIGIRLWHVDARLFKKKDTNINFYSNAEVGNVVVAFTNTYYHDEKDLDYMSELYTTNHKYGDYNILQLIRNNTSTTYYPEGLFTKKDLFTEGSSFDIERYSRQFVNGMMLNKGVSFPWSFKVEKISTSESGDVVAEISVTLN